MKLKKLFSLFLAICLLCCFASCDSKANEKQKFTETYIDYFDTGSTIVGFDTDISNFEQNCDFIKQQLSEYNNLYDIYKSYEGINNIRTINQKAGIEPVRVDTRIIEMLEYCKEIYTLTDGKVNVAMGSVLSIWHNYRTSGINDPENAALPNDSELQNAAKYTDFNKVIIDKENSTVYLEEPEMSLDVGAIAKGYATEQIALALIEKGVTNYTLNIGGNIRTIGPKGDGSPWTAAVANPDTTSEEPTIMTVKLNNKVFVTSGSYQRYYVVDGKSYHHIINPDTLYPENNFTAVSIYADDSGLADALSTAVFNLSYEDGKKLIDSLDGVEALWVTNKYEVLHTDGFADIIVE